MPKQATHKNLPASDAQSPLYKRLREGAVIVSLALALFLVMSLLTYDRADGGWSHTGYALKIHNSGGQVGAWFSDFFLYVFGYMAYFFPILMLYSVWSAFKKQYQDHVWAMVALRAAGFMFILISMSALIELFIHTTAQYLPYTTGGILGHFATTQLVDAINVFGTVVFFVAMLLIGVTLFTGLSWLEMLEKMGKLFVKSCALIKSSASQLWTSLKARQQARQIHSDLALKPTPPPVVRTPEVLKAPSRIVASMKKSIQLKPTEQVKKSQVPKVSTDMPPLSLLDHVKDASSGKIDKEKIELLSSLVEQRLLDFGIKCQVVEVIPGPVVTRFELQLAPGIKVSRLTAIAKDIARSLSVQSVRVVEVIPGKSTVGIELPNETREMVKLHEILASDRYEHANAKLSLALGKDISGLPVVVDLSKMPHLLVAGTTGSGKSVCINAMILSLLYKNQPEDVRLIMIDPKMLELSVYDGIPHLLTPVVTDMKDSQIALRWCVIEMERRYALMADLGVRNLASYNKRVKDSTGKPDFDTVKHMGPLPKIVVIIDELADMMMVVGKKVEQLIARIAQKARASGIHMVLATQRPSVDVITGLIKSNIPTRIAFQVSSKIDSRTILDQQGAEQLLGSGDMLYQPPGVSTPMRVHGAFVSDEEVHKVVADWKAKQSANYDEGILNAAEEGGDGDFSLLGESSDEGEADPLYDKVVAFVTETRRVSVSSVQRSFKIGYNRAARIVEDMERAGVVSPMESNGQREVLAPAPVK